MTILLFIIILKCGAKTASLFLTLRALSLKIHGEQKTVLAAQPFGSARVPVL